MKNSITSIHVTNHSEADKMSGIQSISTSVLSNELCQARRNIPGSVCAGCYADGLCRCRKNLDAAIERNAEVLSARLLSMEEAAAVPVCTIYARIESFGDARDAMTARNYIRIIKAHPLQHWGLWSKNWKFYYDAFQAEGKPENLSYVHSSLMLDTPDAVPEEMRPYVDHVFTVYSSEEKYLEAIADGSRGACAGIRCMTCLKCYTHDGSTPFHIAELLRKRGGKKSKKA